MRPHGRRWPAGLQALRLADLIEQAVEQPQQSLLQLDTPLCRDVAVDQLMQRLNAKSRQRVGDPVEAAQAALLEP